MSKFHFDMLVTAASAALLAGATASAQPAPAFPNPAITLDAKGITVNGTDGVTKINFRFRVQQLASATIESETDDGVTRTNLAIRRMRLRLDGTLRDPRLRVNVQRSRAAIWIRRTPTSPTCCAMPM
jgi:hypothetical protein